MICLNTHEQTRKFLLKMHHYSPIASKRTWEFWRRRPSEKAELRWTPARTSFLKRMSRKFRKFDYLGSIRVRCKQNMNKLKLKIAYFYPRMTQQTMTISRFVDKLSYRRCQWCITWTISVKTPGNSCYIRNSLFCSLFCWRARVHLAR